jgi:hypothetical protein
MAELKKAARRDMQAAWLAFSVMGFGLMGAGVVALQLPNYFNWATIGVGLVIVIVGCCKVTGMIKR